MNLAMPWASTQDRAYSSPTSLLVKMRLGEAPDHVPAMQDVRECCHDPAHSIDGGPIDRVLSVHAGSVRVAKLHCAAANQHRRRCRHIGYDDIEHLTGIARTFFLKVPVGAPIARICDILRQTSTVEHATPNYIATLPMDIEQPLARDRDTNDAQAWKSRNLVALREALAHEPGDPDTLIGLIDSGISLGHPELEERFSEGGYDTVKLHERDVAAGVRLLGDYDENDPHPVDDFVGHGMGCAGIMVGNGRNMPPGLGGACRVVPMRALGAAKVPHKVPPVGLGALSDLDLAMSMAVNSGAKVLNLSFGTSEDALAPESPRPHADTVQYAIERGCILVAASGNSGEEERFWPSANPDVIAVGAVNDEGAPAAFSTRGDHVALSAPGASVLTTSLGSYQNATGTSFAAPFVAATAALMATRAARLGVQLSCADAHAILTHSTRPFANGAQPLGYGSGILDAASALTSLDEMIVQSTGPTGGQYVH